MILRDRADLYPAGSDVVKLAGVPCHMTFMKTAPTEGQGIEPWEVSERRTIILGPKAWPYLETKHELVVAGIRWKLVIGEAPRQRFKAGRLHHVTALVRRA